VKPSKFVSTSFANRALIREQLSLIHIHMNTCSSSILWILDFEWLSWFLELLSVELLFHYHLSLKQVLSWSLLYVFVFSFPIIHRCIKLNYKYIHVYVNEFKRHVTVISWLLKY